MGIFGLVVSPSSPFSLIAENLSADIRPLDEAGVTNGQDMVAAYIREKWPGPTAEAILAMADVGDRQQEYGSSKASNNAWWLWTVVRAWAWPSKK